MTLQSIVRLFPYIFQCKFIAIRFIKPAELCAVSLEFNKLVFASDTSEHLCLFLNTVTLWENSQCNDLGKFKSKELRERMNG